MKAGSFLAPHLTRTNQCYAISRNVLLDNFSTYFLHNFYFLLKSREAKLSLASCLGIIWSDLNRKKNCPVATDKCLSAGVKLTCPWICFSLGSQVWLIMSVNFVKQTWQISGFPKAALNLKGLYCPIRTCFCCLVFGPSNQSPINTHSQSYRIWSEPLVKISYTCSDKVQSFLSTPS